MTQTIQQQIKEKAEKEYPSQRYDAGFEKIAFEKGATHFQNEHMPQVAVRFTTWMEDNNFYRREDGKGVRLYTNKVYGNDNTKEELFKIYLTESSKEKGGEG